MPMITKPYWLISAAMVVLLIVIFVAMGRPPICECGTISLWHGAVNSPENSQQISDWYSFSHIIHGFIFYGAGALFLRKYPKGVWLIAAIFLEGAWEILENSPIIINRYREATMAFGYSGDSILNSVSDVMMMTAGFFIASRLPVWGTVALAIIFELFTLYTIRDNLTLNVLMLVSPIEAVKEWQGAG